MPKTRAFTLIELLIVVAIIAILAAIAVPNFLEAQTRSKVSRVKTDLRSVTTALESYYVDHNSYVRGNDWGVAGRRPTIANDQPVLELLSTPVAYLSTGLMPDVFIARKRSASEINGNPPLIVNINDWTDTPDEGNPEHFLYRTYLYISTRALSTNPSGLDRVIHTQPHSADGFILYSAGPMQAYINAGGVVANSDKEFAINLIYDPTNGTVSFGNIWRGGGSPTARDNIYGAIDTAMK